MAGLLGLCPDVIGLTPVSWEPTDRLPAVVSFRAPRNR